MMAKRYCHIGLKIYLMEFTYSVKNITDVVMKIVNVNYFAFSSSTMLGFVVKANILNLQLSQSCLLEMIYGNNIVNPPSSYSHQTSMFPLFCFVLNSIIFSMPILLFRSEFLLRYFEKASFLIFLLISIGSSMDLLLSLLP